MLLTAAAACADQAQSSLEGQENKPLSQMTLQELGEVKVTAVSKEPEEVWNTPAAIDVLTADDIRQSGATNIPDLLRRVPGVEVAQIGSDLWSVGIRGFGSRLSRSMLVLIDGRSVYSPLFAGVYWEVQNVPLEDIERIEVIRGPGGTIWGANAVNGVINIITKSARDTRGLQATAGGGNVEQASGGLQFGGGSDGGLSYRVYAQGFTRGPEFHSTGPNYDDWRMGQGGFRMDWQTSHRDDFTLEGDAYNGDAGEQASYTTYTPPYSAVVDGNSELSGADLVGHWKRTLKAGSDVQVTAYYDRTRHFEPQFGEVRDTADIDFLHHLSLRGHQDFIWGAGGRISSGNFAERVPTINFIPHHRTDKLFNAFLQDEFPIGSDRLHLTIGSKFEDNNYTGFEFQPTARLLWTPTPRQTVWTAVTRAVRTPSRLDEDVQLIGFIQASPLVFFALDGNGQFISETMIGYEAGYRGLLTPKLYVDVTAFDNFYNHLFSYGFQDATISSVTSPPPSYLLITFPIVNGSEGTTDGVEVAPDWRPTRWWQLKGSYSYLHMHIYPRPGSLDKSSPALENGSSPGHQFAIQSSFSLPKGMEFDQSYQYVSSLPALKVPSYQTAGLRFGWHFGPNTELSVVGENLLSPYHFEYAGTAGAPVGIKRSVYASLTFTWDRSPVVH